MVKNTAAVSKSSAAEVEKKKKRPWRNKVRKQAQKKAAQAEREANPVVVVPSDPSAKKKKKRSKKKKFVPTEAEAEKSEVTVEGEEEEQMTAVEEAKKKLDAGRFRYLNEQLYTMSGSDALQFFKEDPESFMCYHKGFADQVKKWPNHPLQAIIAWLDKFKEKKVVYDLGCGEAKIAEAVKRHEVQSFDLVAVNERVTACDMAHLPREDASADIVVFCLSLMGTNIQDFIKEARRVLKEGGVLKIAEVTSRFVNVKLFCDAVCKMGFTMGEKREMSDYFMMMQFTKIAKVENKRPFGLKLKPCMYKKR